MLTLEVEGKRRAGKPKISCMDVILRDLISYGVADELLQDWNGEECLEELTPYSWDQAKKKSSSELMLVKLGHDPQILAHLL